LGQPGEGVNTVTMLPSTLRGVPTGPGANPGQGASDNRVSPVPVRHESASPEGLPSCKGCQ
jgi:hypothetical protein